MPDADPAVAGDDVVVSVRNVTKKFGDTLALDDVSVDVHRSELVVLLGLSGSGKSTLLRCLNGLHPVTSGTVEVGGTRVDTGVARAAPGAAPQRRIRVPALQPRRPAELPGERAHRRARASCALPRYGSLTYPKRMRADALGHLDRVGLAEFAERRADTLSGGQQQRVAIARTLMQRPGLAAGRRAGRVARSRKRRCGDGSALPGLHRGEAHRGVHAAPGRPRPRLGAPPCRAAQRPEGTRPARRSA